MAPEIKERDGQPHDDVQERERQLEKDDAAHGDARQCLEEEQAGIERPDQFPVVAEPEVQEGAEGRLQLHLGGGDLDQRRREQRPARHGQEADDRRRDHGHQPLVAHHGVQRVDQPVVHAPALLHGADGLHQDDDQEQFESLGVAQPLPGAAGGLEQVAPEQDDGERGDGQDGKGKLDLPAQEQDEQHDQHDEFKGQDQLAFSIVENRL